MFQEIGGTEILLIAIVALIVVGPKDLPVLLRKLGQFTAKLRGMASEFRASFDEMARQSELDELRKEVEAMRRGQWTDPAASEAFNDIHQNLSEVGVDLNAPTHYQYADADIAAAADAAEVPAPAPVKKPRARKAAASSAAKPAAKRASAKPKPATTAAAAPAKRASAKRKPAAKTETGA